MVRLVRAIGALERVLAARDPARSPALPRPLGGLSPEWIAACGDSTEVRLAAAIAGLAGTGGVGPFRSYVAPVDPAQAWKYLNSSRTRAWFGATLAQRLAGVLSRRILDARRAHGASQTRNPTWGPWQVRLDDIGGFLALGGIDDAALDDLIFGFTWVRHQDADGHWTALPPPSAAPVPREYSLLKLLFLPRGLRRDVDEVALTPPGELVPLLLAGRVDDAVALATRTLAARGLRPRRLARRGAPDAEFGARLAAALLIPMFQTDHLSADALLPTDSAHPTEENLTDAL
jgi:CRISPR-associated protein Csx17